VLGERSGADLLDFNCAEQVVGIEMLNVSSRSPDLNVDAFHFETV